MKITIYDEKNEQETATTFNIDPEVENPVPEKTLKEALYRLTKIAARLSEELKNMGKETPAIIQPTAPTICPHCSSALAKIEYTNGKIVYHCYYCSKDIWEVKK